MNKIINIIFLLSFLSCSKAGVSSIREKAIIARFDARIQVNYVSDIRASLKKSIEDVNTFLKNKSKSKIKLILLEHEKNSEENGKLLCYISLKDNKFLQLMHNSSYNSILEFNKGKIKKVKNIPFQEKDKKYYIYYIDI